MDGVFMDASLLRWIVDRRCDSNAISRRKRAKARETESFTHAKRHPESGSG
jgi:hypothetical protein